MKFVEGKETSLIYEKKDGTTRKANGKDFAAKGATIAYYDLDVDDYRSFRTENIVSITHSSFTLTKN